VSLAGEWPELPELAHNGWELATWSIIGIVAVIAFWIWTEHKFTRSQIRGVAKGVNEVREHVSNSHDSNMRDDLDEAKDSAAAANTTAETVLARVEDLLVSFNDLRSEVREQRKDIGGVRQELRDDRDTHHRDITRVELEIENIKRNIS
jgi:hypothetical protein